MGAVGCSRSSLSNQPARAIELATGVRPNAVFAGDSAADSRGIMRPLTSVRVWASRTRWRGRGSSSAKPQAIDRSRGREAVVVAPASVRGCHPAFGRPRRWIRECARVLGRLSSQGLQRRRSLTVSAGVTPGSPVCTPEACARNHPGDAVVSNGGSAAADCVNQKYNKEIVGQLDVDYHNIILDSIIR
jgi:hypothetical protein